MNKIKIITVLIVSMTIISSILLSCSNSKSKTKEMLGTWQIVNINITSDYLENAQKIEFFEGTDELVNLFYLYSSNGEKYEGQWNIKDNEFYMKFHNDENRIILESYNLDANQFTGKGLYRVFTSSDKYDDSFCSIVLKR